MPVPRRPLALVALVAAGASTLLLASCGTDETGAVLAIDEATWAADGRLRLTTECAGDVAVELGADAGGSDLLQVTLRGEPKVGRCHPAVVVAVPAGTTKVIDAATSQVVDLPPAP